MFEPDNGYIESLREAITQLRDGTADLFAEHGDQPAPESPAQEEINASPRSESIITACSIATQLIEYSSEHLTTFVKNLTEPIEPTAAHACVRSMLEPCALSAWMMDPTIDHNERVARVFAHRYEGFEQELKFGRVVSAQPAELDAHKQHIDDVERTAIALGYPPIVDSKGKRIGIGKRMPGATEIIRLMLNEEKMYRLLSAVAHGHQWAIMQLAFKPVESNTSTDNIAGISVKRFKKHVSVKGMAYLGLCGAKAFVRPLWYMWTYMGWDRQPLTVLFENVFDQLQAKDRARVWRSLTD